MAVLFTILSDLGQVDADPDTIEAMLTPNVIDLEVDPGDAVERTLTLSYKSGPPVTAIVNKFDFRQLPDGAFELLPADTAPSDEGHWNGAAWVAPPSASPHLTSGQDLLLKVLISVPEETEPGEYHSFLGVDFPGLVSERGISLVPRLGARFYITVRGEHRRQADDVRVSFENMGPLGIPGPVEIAINLHNSGTLHLDGSGRVELQERITGATWELLLPRRRILPEEEARLTAIVSGNDGVMPLHLYHGHLILTDPALAAALPNDEFDLWLVDLPALIAWAAFVAGAWITWKSGAPQGVGRRLRRAVEAFWRG